MNYGLWQIRNSFPERVRESAVDLEQHFEEWIEKDPNLLQAGLTIVGRQVNVEGGRVDLLGLDPNGRWVVVEIKRGVNRPGFSGDSVS